MTDSYRETFIRIALQAALATGLLLFGGFVYAQVIERAAVTESSVNILPGAVESSGWTNTEAILVQNLSGDALFQEFNQLNSAYIRKNARTDTATKLRLSDTGPMGEDDDTSSSTSSTAATTTAAATTTPPDTNPAASATSSAPTGTPLVTTVENPTTTAPTNVVATSTTSTIPVDTETETETETTTEVSQPGTSTTEQAASKAPFFARVWQRLPFTQAGTTTVHNADTTPAVDAADTDDNDDSTTDSATVATTSAVATTATTTTEDSDPVVATTSSSTVEETNETLDLDSPATTTATTTTAKTTATTTAHEVVDVPATEPDAAEDTKDPVMSDDPQAATDSERYSLTLQEFWLPVFEDDVQITGGQLRVSMAAQNRTFRSDEDTAFVVEYSLDNGASWSAGGTVDTAGETSNSINGDYFLFALPDMSDPDDLANLAIRISFVGEREDMEAVYVDAAWLELFIQEGVVPAEDPLRNFDDNFQNAVLQGDVLVLPNGERITFDFTDSNYGEDLIIKSDDVRYAGLSEATMYFNVTNTSNRADEFNIKAYFPGSVGSVKSIQVWNQNKPRTVVIPEYRPFVYHCAGGWEPGQLPLQEEVARAASSTVPAVSDAANEVRPPSTTATTTVSDIQNVTTTSSQIETTSVPTEADTTREESVSSSSASTTVQSLWDGAFAFAQSSVATTSTSTDTEAELNDDTSTDYYCAATAVQQTCDLVDGDGTECRIEKRRVAEHEKTAYRSGWDTETISTSTENTNVSRIARLGGLLGVAPAVKPVPHDFTARAETPDNYAILPGETRYFKMTIEFPPFTQGEFWIEAIGTKAYGLLDPFWSSQWRYRKPITIDNTAGSALLEQQVFVELTSADSDFWSNVQSDGGDIRFVRETPGNNLTWWDTDWTQRLEITIPASQVDDDVSDFPVYVDLATLGSEFFAGVQSDGDDIRLLNSAGSAEMAYDLVSINTGAETGELHFEADSLSSTTDTVFYLYFNNPSAAGYGPTDTFGSEAVWDNSFDLRYAMDDDPTSGGDQFDSTSNGNNAPARSGMTAGDVVAGQIGEALNHDGNDGGIFNTALAYGGEFTASMWWRSSGDGFAISINAGANEKMGPWSGGNTFVRAISSSDQTIASPADGTWAHVVLTRDSSDKVDLYINGTANRLYGDAAQSGTSDWENFGGQTTQGFNGDLDELRFASVKRSDGWVSTEYNNQSDPGSFYATSSVETLAYGSFTELDHWVQYFDYSAQEADVWVQVDTLAAAASTTIHMYYGNSEAESTSDEFAPFTYSTTTDLYYLVNDSQSSAFAVYSLIDNNEVAIDGGATVALDAGETTSFATYSSTSVISALGPVTMLTIDDGNEPFVPISFATTSNLVTTDRGTEEFHVLAPFNTADVYVYAGASVAESASSTVLAQSTDSYIVNLSNEYGVVESDEPVLLFHDSNNNQNDAYPAYPPTLRDIYGVHSSNYQYSSVAGGTSLDIFCSSGATSSQTGIGRGSEQENTTCTGAGNGTGNGVRLANQTAPIAATQEADGNGGESSRFLPTPEFGTTYYFPQDASYVSVVCAPRFGEVDLEIQDTIGGTVTSATCTPGADTPDIVNFTTAAPYTQGYSVVSTNDVPFYMYYEEDAGNNETHSWGAVQAKQYNALYMPHTIGAQEVNTDAQYEQQNYAWYENVNALTPVDYWPLDDGETVAEAEGIGSGGAVNPGDVLRLRMNLLANNGTGTVESTAFQLQYAQAETCSSLTEDNWLPVAEAGSTTVAFAGYDNAAPADGATLPSTVLSDSDVVATYEEENFSSLLPNEVASSSAVEFDWVITSVAPAVNSEYCFRMIRSTGEAISTYTTYPELLTAGPPGATSLLTPFDNEHATSTSPDIKFVAADIGGDDLDYEIDIATDAAFSSIVMSRNSDSNPFEFENVAFSSDKAPFNNGQQVRFTPPSSLSNGQTYWWRVRAIDPDGSNTYGAYSTARSFTINTSVSVSEWFQTTDDQFETNTLTSATTSGSGSVELNIAGSNLVGEYGSIALTNGVSSTVSLTNTYSNPVVVASIRYPKTVTNNDQPAARVSNKTASSFVVLADNYDNTAPGTSTVDYMVLEAGEWLLDDGDEGIRVYATSTTVSVNDGATIATDPGGTVVTYPTSFSGPPAVFTMVTTDNDPQWVVSTVYDGNNIGNPPTASQLTVFLNDNVVSDGHGSSETVDVIVLDIGSGTNDSVTFDSLTTATDVSHVPNTEPFNATFSSTPQTTVVQSLTTNGAQGGYAMVDLDNPTTVTDITVAIEEGGPADRTHANEQVAIVAFEDASGDLIRAGTAQMVSTAIDYDDVVVGNAWGEVSWNDTGDVSYHLEYDTGSGFVDIPDSALAGNSSGFTVSPINILDLNTETYNRIRLVADLSGVDPEVFDWTVSWGKRVEIPTLGDPFDNEKTSDTTPTFDFYTTDPEGDDLVYELSYSTDPSFTSSTTVTSSTSVNFANSDTPADLDPYNSGDTITYIVPGGSALTDGETYWWRVRAKDPNGSDSFSPWSEADNVTIDTTVSISTWFQTTQAQFQQGVLDGLVATTTGSVELTSEIGEYGTTTLTDNDWTTINTELTYDNMVVIASPVYDFDTTSDNGRTPQVRNKTNDSFDIKVEDSTLSLNDTTIVHYLVMEAGDWTIEDGSGGTRVVAGTAPDVSAVRGSSAGYSGGTTVDFTPDFSAPPAVFATVASANGSKWVATVLDDGTQAGEVTAADMNVSLGVGYDTDTIRDPEDVDYIAIDVTTGSNNSVLFDALNSPDSVTDGGATVTFNQTFSSAPGLTLVHNNATDGGDGGFAQVDTQSAITASNVYLSVAEIPANGGHTAEIVSLLAFESDSGTILRDTTIGGGLTGTIGSEPVLFSDGLGPKFDRALFSATTPGNSTTSIQIQYQTATGSWALVPDGDLSGNSSGFTSSPINLSGLNVVTYPVIRLLGTLSCDGSNCPTLDDWTVEWSEGVTMSGTLQEFDRVTNVSTATVTVSINGAAPTRTGSVSGGNWSINNVTAFAGDVLTVFVDDVPDANEAVGVFVYDGLGDMTGVELYERHLSLASDETNQVTLSKLALSDNSVIGDEDVFFDVDGSGNLDVCAVGSCSDGSLYVGSENSFIIATSSSYTVTTHDFVNDGTVAFDANTMEVSGSWDDNATTSLDTSTITFTAATGTETLSDSDGVLDFYNLTFGAGSGVATWQPDTTLDVNGALTVAYGTLDRASYPITVARALSTDTAGYWSGFGTTTFDGSGSYGWSDSNSTPQNVGHVVVDGMARTVVVGSDVRASSLSIGANDTLNAGGNYDIYLSGDFNNNNIFTAQTSQIVIDGAATDATITTGGSSLYALRASSTGGSIAFTESSVTLLDNLSIATGTITFPTSKLTVGGSLQNEGGTFAHNNAEVDFVGAGSETIQLLGSSFLNALYDVTFSGAGDWTFLDTHATTSGSISIENGDVTFPSGQLTVGRNFDVTGSGGFAANDGEVVLLVQSTDQVTTNGSAFNDVRVRELPGALPWYDDAWPSRIQVTIRSSEVDDDLTNFPVYVDLADLASSFFTDITSDGGDIRVTESDGVTEVPREVVSASTTGQTGELYFRATALSSTTDTTFFVYYGNNGASDYAVDDPFGAENVWSNGYVLVAHMGDETTSSVINSADSTADGSKDAANQPLGTENGWVYDVQDFGGTGHIEFPNVGNGATEITISAWINPDNLSGSGDTSTYGFSIFSAHSASNYTWLTAGGTSKGSTEMHFCAFDSDAAGCDSTTGANLSTGEWRYVSATGIDGGAAAIRLEDTELASFTSNGGGAWNSVSTIGDLRPDRDIEFEGRIDEVQISDVVRSVAWQDATYRNQATTTDFYAASAPQSSVLRTFADTNTTIAGDLIIESGDVLFPTGVLAIGGSLDNDSEFDSNMGTVSFTTATATATVAPGVSTFYNLQVNSSGGDLSIIEHATATNGINLIAANDFTVNPAIILESQGSFQNTIASSSTTWTGSELKLSSGSTVSVNTTAASGDTYDTLTTAVDTHVTWWNSSASTYNLAASSSVYSKDHAAVDGDLYIFGEYERTSGTEYWNYATDFDGTSLVGGGERAVQVRVANGARVGVTGATLQAYGTTSASTTIDAQAGTYTWVLDDATLQTRNLTVTGGDTAGLQLLGSTTVSTFTDTIFTIPAVSAALTLSSTTIDTNPATQYFGVDFVSGGGNTNVNLLDAPTSFWWFREGVNDRYGEAYDNGDGDPGAVRWDDSSYQIDISGVVYSDNGATPQGGPVCDGSTANVRVVVDGGTYTDTTSCDGVSGAYSFSNVSYIGDPVVHVYLDTAGGTTGAVVTKTPTGDLTDLDLYANRVITRHEDTVPLTITDLAVYDSSDDLDIPFTAATSGTPSLTTRSDTALYVWDGDTFTPEGPVTLEADAAATAYDGTLYLGAGATFTATGTTQYSIGGSLLAASGATLTTASSTFVFTATTTGKVISGSSTLAFNELVFNGAAGSWSIDSAITTATDVSVAAGTVTGSGDITIANGSLAGNGTVDMTGGTVTINHDNTLGGSNPWQFNNLTLGNGSVAGITTPASTATTTVRNVLTIAAGHFFDAGSAVLNLAGSGNVLVENGTFLEDTGTVQYSGATPNVLRTTYYNLLVDDATTSVAAVAPTTGLQILNDLTIGERGTASLNLDTNDPLTSVAGDVYIGSGGTLIASASTNLQTFGSWQNDGSFTANGGTVTFASADAASIDAGNSAFANVLLTAAGPYTSTAHATATANFSIAGITTYTQQSGTTLAVGGQFLNATDGTGTTWTGSTLLLYGGQAYEISDKTRRDDYATIVVADGTHPRLWNSTMATVTTNGVSSLYVMDHDDVSGEAYIYGDYVNSSFDDTWSYATDFDGTAGVSRQVGVYIEDGGSVSYTGGSLAIVGTTSASTTLQSFSGGTYSFSIGGTASTSWRYVAPRDLDSTGIEFTNTPEVHDFSYLDLLVESNSATAVTVAGGVIDQNPAQNFTNNYFNAAGGVTGASNVTASGTSISSWRFTNHNGNLDGEGFDNDTGDPGEIVWEDSAAEITVGGTVYSDEGSTVSGVCDGSTANIVVRVAGLTSYTGSCDGGTGAYAISGVAFSANDTLTVYINGEAVSAANVSIDPASNIGNMDLYEDRVIVRHEGSDPITIADMAVWDSSDDGDIPFTAVDAATDTLTLPANTKLIVWNSKEFAPGGNVTVSGGGAGDAVDGTFEVFPAAQFTAAGTESHVINGSFILDAGAVFTSASSTMTFSSTATSRTIDTNEHAFHNVAFTGSGDWTVTDANMSVYGDLDKSAGTVTLPTGTTTVAGDFDNTGGSINASTGVLRLTASDAGNTLTLNGSSIGTLLVDGGGSYTVVDTNVTIADDVSVLGSTITLGSGTTTVGGSVTIDGGSTLAHNNGVLELTATTTETITLSSNDLYSLYIVGTGDFTMTDATAALRGTLTVATGTLHTASSTLSIAGSLDATGGVLDTASSTILFDSTDIGELVDPGANDFYNVVVSSPSGGWTFASATTTNTFSVAQANVFTLGSGETLHVGGVFSNAVGGAATTWTGSTLQLAADTIFSVSDKNAGTEVYGDVVLLGNTDVQFWNSSFATTSVAASSSIYSQDHAGVNGDLLIAGEYQLASGAEYWSYATDFDGTALSGGARRAVSVTFDDTTNASFGMTGGTLEVLGEAGATTTISTVGAGQHSMTITGGTFNAAYYSFDQLDIAGLVISGTPNIVSLSNGHFTQGIDIAQLITLNRTALNANAGLLIDYTQFDDGGFIAGDNVVLSATSTNAWQFRNHSGDLDGEDYDIDGVDNCGSIRWDDSDCQLLEQTTYRWRNDDGGLGVPSSEWFDSDWNKRKRVKIENSANTTFSSTSVEITVTYDANMQSDFDDLRFTDETGLVEIPYWIEKRSNGVSAQVWLFVEELPARGIATFFMYYDNVAVTTTSDADAVFTALDDFEDGNISEYSGDTFYEAGTDTVYGGTYALAPQSGNEGDRAIDGIARFDQTVSQGETLRWRQYIDTSAGSDDETCTLFAVQSPVTVNQNYGICLEQFGTDRMVIAENVESTDSFGSVSILASTTLSYTTGWYEVVVDWQDNNTIAATLYNPSGTMVATTSVSDSTYTSGGYGFTSWGQNGAWDSFVSYSRLTTQPAVQFGLEQTEGGASWNAALNTAANNVSLGAPIRLRVALENSGLDLTAQQYQLEYAAKGAAPSCEAVDVGDFAAVPVVASCGGSDICMATTSNFANLDATTDLLLGSAGGFSAGQAIKDASNKTSSYNLASSTYTEIEYAITPTINVSDEAYCFRVSNDGTELDSYATIAEMGLEFTPQVDTVTLNDGLTIDLTLGTTTAVIASTTVTDLNGFADITAATTTFYKSDVAGLADCVEDDNNCYRTTLADSCTLNACSGNSCSLQCVADFAFHTDPTDSDGGTFWYAYVEVNDSTDNSDFATSPANDVGTLRGLDVVNAIDYGTLGVNQDTGSYNASTTVRNLGNEAIDVNIIGTDLSDGGVSVIDVAEQRFATSTFTYSACTVCATLNETGVPVELDLPKPATTTPPVADDVFWGINIPFGTNSAAHTGTNSFIATGD